MEHHGKENAEAEYPILPNSPKAPLCQQLLRLLMDLGRIIFRILFVSCVRRTARAAFVELDLPFLPPPAFRQHPVGRKSRFF